MSLDTIKSGIDRFLFAPVSPYPVAAFRVLFGLLLLQNALFIYPDLLTWLGREGIISYQSVSMGLEKNVVLNIFNFQPGNDTWVLTVFGAYVVASVLLTIGFQTRLASIVVYLYLVSLYHRDPFLLNSGDTLMRSTAFFMMFAPAGGAWSVDHWLRKRSLEADYCELVSAWGMRCLQLQICAVYYDAFFAKSPGWVWVLGSAVYLASRIEPLARFPLPISPESFEVSRLVTWGTLFIEFILFSFIWIRQLRYYVLALGIIMHLVIDWTMNIPQFEWLMITLYIVFVYPVDLDRIISPAIARLSRKKPA